MAEVMEDAQGTVNSGGGLRLPPAAGASPRVHPGSSAEFGHTQQDSVAHELRMLNWYKLANEAAMKAALVKQKRFKEVPRYNPAAERVRQRASWMEQVIAEEQNKPLELPKDRYSDLLQQEATDRIKFAEKSQERFKKIKMLKRELEDKEMRKLQYRRFLAEQEKQRRAAMAKDNSLDALYGMEPEVEPAEVGMSVDAIVNLQKLERLEERMATIIQDTATTSENAIVLDLTQAGDVGVNTVKDGNTATLNAEQVTFIKRRTEPRLHQPSQVYYTAKVLPANEVRREVVSLRAEFNNKDIPPHIMQHMRTLEQQRTSMRSDGSDRHDARTSLSANTRELSRDELRAKHSSEAVQKRHERDEARQRELMEQDRVDEVIKDWLRGRNRRALRREKKVRDMLRADRRFLSTLQVSKEAKAPDDKSATAAAAAAALPATSNGWTPNVASGDYKTDDIDKRLEVLLQQQKQMEKWKPKSALK